MRFKKTATWLCVGALLVSCSLDHVRKAESIPLPGIKPEKIAHVETTPVRREILEPMTLNLASLFSPEIQRKKPKQYPHGYTPLAAKDAKLYAQIFERQTLGHMKDADTIIEKINDDRLMGHVLYQRYMHPAYKTRFTELQNWMKKYADHPDSHKIYKLALSRKTKGASLKKPTNSTKIPRINEPTIYHAKHANGANAKSERKQAATAAKFLYRGNLEKARETATRIADRSGAKIPQASWIAGLALWQQGKFTQAAAYFEKTGNSPYASGWLASAGSYWAARSYEKISDKEQQKHALQNAAKHDRTFYGLLASHALGQNFEFSWDTPKYSREDETLILGQNAGKRAYSLIAAGQYALAESELMRLDYKGNKPLKHAALAYATHVGLPGLALRLGNMVKNDKGGYYDSALYPVSPWSPEDGYVLDPALIHAVIRQESRFNQNAKSKSGAKGLMQIMPKTAHYIAKTKNYNKNLNVSKLNTPETNMKTGQDYLDYLLHGRFVNGDIISLLVAYNAGPGNLLKWRKSINTQDPLLFIEMLPSRETRGYVERVLSNYWIYRLRAGMNVPSLATLSEGKFAQYAHIMQTDYPYKLAANQ